MAIVCIKIGENELSSYPKFNKLSKHMDIVEVLPRKRDKDGNIIERTMGIQGDKQYLGLNVDMSDLTDEEFSKVRWLLRERWEEMTFIDDETPPVINLYAKRKRKIDLSSNKRGLIGLSDITVDKIESKANLKRMKQNFDMMEINRFDKTIPFNNFAKIIINKETGKTLEEELNLTQKTIKQVAQEMVEEEKQRIIEKRKKT